VANRYPQARVQLTRFPTDSTSQHRSVHAPSGLQPGAIALVEVGATWGMVDGRDERVDGAWIECEVIPKPADVIGEAGGVTYVKRRGT
jgi:hypothetical protein